MIPGVRWPTAALVSLVAASFLPSGSSLMPGPAGYAEGAIPDRLDPLTPPTAAQPTLRVTNLVPAFLAFHQEAAALEEAARADAADDEWEPDLAFLAEARRELWQEHLPQTEALLASDAGEPWVPGTLEEAWPRYGSALEGIRAFEGGISPDPAGVLREVAQLLRLDRALEVHLVLYVGTFEDDPAFRLRDGEFTVLLPVEALPAARRPLLVDLFTRAVHARLAGRPAPGRELSLGQHLVIRGLALRVNEELRPGRPAQEYLLRSQDWLVEAERRDGPILDWVRPRISVDDPEQLAFFLDGGGVTGLAGEFDYAAWRVSGLLMIHGWTLHRLAREPIGDLDRLVREVLAAD